MTRLLDVSGPTQVLAIGAHPDDVEIGAGGLLARLSRAGHRVVVAVASAPSKTKERIAEAQRSAELLGAELVMLQGNDGMRVEDLPMYKLVARMDELVASVKPELV